MPRILPLPLLVVLLLPLLLPPLPLLQQAVGTLLLLPGWLESCAPVPLHARWGWCLPGGSPRERRPRAAGRRGCCPGWEKNLLQHGWAESRLLLGWASCPACSCLRVAHRLPAPRPKPPSEGQPAAGHHRLPAGAPLQRELAPPESWAAAASQQRQQAMLVLVGTQEGTARAGVASRQRRRPRSPPDAL